MKKKQTQLIGKEGNFATGEILFYQTEDGATRVDVRLQDETVWLSQMQMAELFQTSKQNISLHIGNVFDERELLPEATVKEFLTVQNESNHRISRKVSYYNLDVIISVGYIMDEPTLVEQHFLEAVRTVKQLEKKHAVIEKN